MSNLEKCIIGYCFMIALFLFLGRLGFLIWGITGLIIGVCISVILLVMIGASGRDN